MIVAYGLIIGFLASLTWGIALKLNLGVSMLWGLVLGLLIGVFFTVVGAAARSGGKINKAESVFVSSSLMTLIAMGSIGLGLIALVIRVIFFG